MIIHTAIFAEVKRTADGELDPDRTIFYSKDRFYALDIVRLQAIADQYNGEQVNPREKRVKAGKPECYRKK
jgi:hypothetical protein